MSTSLELKSFLDFLTQLSGIADDSVTHGSRDALSLNRLAGALSRWGVENLVPFVEELENKVQEQAVQIDRLTSSVVAAEEAKNSAYSERNRVVAALSKCFPSCLSNRILVEGLIQWRLVLITLPTGQASWHFPESELHLFSHLTVNPHAVWDGHTTEEKYEKLNSLPPLLWAKRSSDAADARLNAADESVQLEARVRELEQALGAKQADIDLLMLEYCPEEMTPQQVEEWGKHQRPVNPSPILEALKQELIEAKKNAPPQRRVVCAANRYTKILIGLRHQDAFMNRSIQKEFSSPEDAYKNVPEQGFVDQFGEFMTRKEAWAVADAAGQILRRCGGDTKDGGTLYSENLY